MTDAPKHRLAAAQAALEEGAEQMWRSVMADAVLVLLETDGVVTRDALRRALEAGAGDPALSVYLRARHRGALNALDGRPPQD